MSSLEDYMTLPFNIAEWGASMAIGREEYFFANNPQGYERVVDILLARSAHAERMRAVIEQHCDETGRKPRRILDTPCGTGIITRTLADSADEIIGVDDSPSMIEYAKRTSREIQWTLDDFHQLDSIPSESIDVYTAVGGTRFIDSRCAFFATMYRVLSQDGIAVLSFEDQGGKPTKGLIHAAEHQGLTHRKAVPGPTLWGMLSPLKCFNAITGRDMRFHIFGKQQ